MPKKQKQRLTYAQFTAIRTLGTLANLTQRYIDEMNGINGQPGVKPLGESQFCAMRAMQRRAIGAVMAEELNEDHLIEYAKVRIAEGVLPSTVCHDLSDIAVVLKYGRAAWKDCNKVSAESIAIVKPLLTKHGLCGKSAPRTRRPSDEEHDAIVALSVSKNGRRYSKTDMARMANWQRRSARRVSESVRVEWRTWSPSDQTILVTKMKDPRRKRDKVVALPDAAQEMLFEMAYEMNERPELRTDEPRIFPYNAKTVSQRYTLAKKELGIEGLHMHDSRADCGTKLVEDDGYTSAQAILVTGHATVHVFESTYLRQDAAKFKRGPANRERAEEADFRKAVKVETQLVKLGEQFLHEADTQEQRA